MTVVCSRCGREIGYRLAMLCERDKRYCPICGKEVKWLVHERIAGYTGIYTGEPIYEADSIWAKCELCGWEEEVEYFPI